MNEIFKAVEPILGDVAVIGATALVSALAARLRDSLKRKSDTSIVAAEIVERIDRGEVDEMIARRVPATIHEIARIRRIVAEKGRGEAMKEVQRDARRLLKAMLGRM